MTYTLKPRRLRDLFLLKNMYYFNNSIVLDMMNINRLYIKNVCNRKVDY